MTYRISDVGTLLADVREQARKTLAERLLARVPADVRNQLVASVNQHVRGLNEQQLVTWHHLLDSQEPS